MRNYIAIFSRNIYEYYLHRDKDLASVAPWSIPAVLVWFNYMAISSTWILLHGSINDVSKDFDYAVLFLIVLPFYYYFGYKKVHLKYQRDRRLFPWFAFYAILSIVAAVLSSTLVREKIVL